MPETRYVTGARFEKLVGTDRIVHHATELVLQNKTEVDGQTTVENIYEVQQEKRKKTYNEPRPVHVSFFVLCNAKLHMLRFVYDFLFKYIPRGHIQLCYQDTDSVIAAFSNSNIDLCVPEDVRNTEEYQRDKVLFTLSLRGSPKP